nr:hypothetical protein [Tanacetum cinerariifolium]
MKDYALLEVILNGDSPPPTRSVDSIETPYPPTNVEEKLARKNELKARGTLLMALSNKHQLKFNSYKTTKSLMKAIKKRFGEGLDQIYDRLQNLISHFEIHGETISQEDLNLKLLRSLPSEWKTHTLIWRNKPDLETLSMDDLYNNLKIYEAEVIGLSSTTQNTQNLAFVSSNNTDSTNKAVNTTHGVSVASSKTNASNLPNVDSLNGNVDYESQKIPIENRKESRASKYQDNRNRKAPRRTVPVVDTTLNALVSQYTEVSTCSKACLKYYETLKEHYDNLTKHFNKSQFNLGSYKAGLESVEARLEVYKKNEVVFEDDINILKLDVMFRDKDITKLRRKFEKAKNERDDLKLTLEKFAGSSKNLSRLLDSQQSDKSKSGLGFNHLIKDCDSYKKKKMVEKPVWNNARRVNHQNSQRLSHPHSKRIVVPKVVLTNSVLKTLNTATQTSSRAAVSVNTARPINTAYSRSNVNGARPASNVFNKAHSHVRRPFNKFTTNKNSTFNQKANTVKGNVTTIRSKAVVRNKKGNKANGNQQQELQEKGVINSGFSGHTTGNMSYPSKYEEIDDGYRKHKSRRKNRKETKVSQDEPPTKEHIPTPSNDLLPSGEDRMKLTELMNLCTKLSDGVLSLEQINTNQAAKIEKLKKRVKKLEGKKKKRTHGLKIMYKVGLSARIISSDKEGLGDQEDASKQGRIAEIDADEDLSLINQDAIVAKKEVSTADLVTTAGEVVTTAEDVEFTTTATPQIYKDDVTLAQTLIEIKTVKARAKDKGTRIMVEPKKPLKKKDQIALDEELAEQVQAQEREHLSIKERSKLLAELIESKRKYFAAKRAEEIKKKPPIKAQQKNLMCTYMKNMKGFKQKDFKGKSVDAIKKIFDKVYKRVNTFVAMDSKGMEGSKKTQAEVTEGSSKRAGDEIKQESAKRQRLEREDDTWYRILHKRTKTKKNGQNRARDQKEHEKPKDEGYLFSMDQPEPILLGRVSP